MMKTVFKLCVSFIFCLVPSFMGGCGSENNVPALTSALTPAEQAEVDKIITEYGTGAILYYLKDLGFLNTTEEQAIKYVKYFITQGADVNANIENPDFRYSNTPRGTIPGTTSLHMAVQYNSIELVKFLVSNGANVNVPNASSTTPLDLAREGDRYWHEEYGEIVTEGNTAIAKYLESVGAKSGKSETMSETTVEVLDFQKRQQQLQMGGIIPSPTPMTPSGGMPPTAGMGMMDGMMSPSDGTAIMTPGGQSPNPLFETVKKDIREITDLLYGNNNSDENASPSGTRNGSTLQDTLTSESWKAINDASCIELEGNGFIFYSSRSIGISHDGKIATARNGTVKIWDVNSGKELQILTHTNLIGSPVFSPDGRKIVTTSNDNSIQIWDANTGRLLQTLRGHTSTVNSAVFSPDERKIASSSEDKTTRIWDANSGKELHKFGGIEKVSFAAFSPDSKKIITTSWTSSPFSDTAQIWDANSGKKLQMLPAGSHPIDVSPDSKKIVTGSNDKSASIWDANSGRELQMLVGHSASQVCSVAFSPDGKKVVTGGNDNTARIWDTDSGRELRKLEGHTSLVNSVTFSPDGTRVLTASYDNTARIWDVDSGREMKKLAGHSSKLGFATFTPDGRKVVTGSTTLRIWDCAAIEKLAEQGNSSLSQMKPIQSVSNSSDTRSTADWMASKGLAIGEKGQNGKTLAHFAAEEGRVDVLELLHSQDSNRQGFFVKSILMETDSGENGGWKPIHFAAFGGQVAAMKWLKEQGVNINDETGWRNSGRCLPIHCAALGGQVEAMKWLKSQGANINATTEPPHQGGQSPMHMAAREGQVEAMKWLKDQGVAPNVKTINGVNSMLEAARGGHVEAMQWLKEQDVEFDGTILRWAARGGHIDAMKWLKEQGADVSADYGSMAPMHHAACTGQVEAMKWLKAQGASINVINPVDGTTPMHDAAYFGQLESMKWLKEQGTDINAKSSGNSNSALSPGSTPMHVATKENRVEVIKWLKSQGADINAKDNRGNTPMHIAAWYRLDVEVLRSLKDNGADINARNTEGKTPLGSALESLQMVDNREQNATVRWLRSNGAR